MRKTVTVELWDNKFVKIVSQINAYEYNLLSKWSDDFFVLSELVSEWNLNSSDILEEGWDDKILDITEDNMKKLDLTIFFVLQKELQNVISRALDKKKLEKLIWQNVPEDKNGWTKVKTIKT